jgi:hypothetical protein
MDGSTNKLLNRLVHTNSTRLAVLASELQKEHDAGIQKTLEYLRESAKSRDVNRLLEDEYLMLTYSLNFDANSPEEMSSLKAAIMQLDEARRCLKSLQEKPEAHRENEASYSSKRKEAGLPLDAAREFIRSHSTRLANSLAARVPQSEKLILRQRRENISAMRDYYIELQHSALSPNKKPEH